eukprot:1261041-Rhodomonas_salina.1
MHTAHSRKVIKTERVLAAVHISDAGFSEYVEHPVPLTRLRNCETVNTDSTNLNSHTLKVALAHSKLPLRTQSCPCALKVALAHSKLPLRTPQSNLRVVVLHLHPNVPVRRSCVREPSFPWRSRSLTFLGDFPPVFYVTFPQLLSSSKTPLEDALLSCTRHHTSMSAPMSAAETVQIEPVSGGN